MSFEVPTEDEYYPAKVAVTFKENGTLGIKCPKPSEYLSEHPSGNLQRQAEKLAHKKWGGDAPETHTVEVSRSGELNYLGEGDLR
ncbi:hypothetical protein [Haloarcula sp. Atlit-120R]|uniref:hypothetical protein n=1 Tax=Haloarcula sp. Atlit-120R TaxID=2282135 RepID=UPI000EF1F010|nr:hypothetical protein [Haloarcula sp. Atlit-120R]RLM32656.1 hypothetical protein DVK01_20505 [Haloarcula sp. Atlit-120R]